MLALRRAGVPDLYGDASWANVAHAKRSLTTYAKSIEERVRLGEGLFLAGPVGTGKSCAAGLIARSAVMRDIAVVWQHVPDVIGKITTPEGKHQLWRASAAELLIWDDFTLAGLTDWQVRELDRVVERRYSSRRSMVVTTNVTQAAMEAPEVRRMADRWGDRCQWVTMSGESLRRGWKTA